MTLILRHPDVSALARRLAEIDRTSIDEAVVTALREAIKGRTARETPTETARRVLAGHGIALTENMREPVPPDAYHELDHEH
jgi:antitoxin VapB